ncbi:MAG: hypothetical protein JWO36_2494 [Myxococcales bacterium]|nr:hypothetical protein [Myxococcales bacterium]
MRISVLSLVIVVACNSSNDDLRVQSPKVAPHAPTEASAIARCPVGDGVNVAVYGFLVREMAERASGSRETTRAALADETQKLADPSIKPPRASIVESEVSHVLTTLCDGTPGCVTTAIYDRSGLAIALSSHRSKIAPYGIGDDARWNALTASSIADGGGEFELACDEAKAAALPCNRDHRLVAFPVFADGALLGLASCIVETRPRDAT